MADTLGEVSGFFATNLGHIQEASVNVYGVRASQPCPCVCVYLLQVSPNFFEVSLSEFLVVGKQDSSGLPLAEVRAR